MTKFVIVYRPAALAGRPVDWRETSFVGESRFLLPEPEDRAAREPAISRPLPAQPPNSLGIEPLLTRQET